MTDNVVDIRVARALRQANDTIVEVGRFLAKVEERERLKKSAPALTSGKDRSATSSSSGDAGDPPPRAA